MSIINLTDAQKNFEEIKLSPQKNFKIKSVYTTDPLNLFDETITDSNSVIVPNYPETGLISYGLIPLYSYKTNTLKDVGNGGNTQIGIRKFLINDNDTNVFNNLTENNFNTLSSSRPRPISNTQLELDSNYFGIKRLKQDLKPFSSNFNKKQIVKKLYQNHRCLSDAKFNQKYHYGFYNYNCFNFFNVLPATKISNQYKGNFKNNSHKNALIYSNQILNNSQIQLGNKNDMTINFWINPKRTALIGKRYNPGCILHLPNIVSIYLVPDNLKLNANNQAIEFKILCHIGEHANKLVLNNTIPNHGKLLSQTNLKLNTWHNISVIINTTGIQLFIDDNLTHTVDEIDDLNIQSTPPSILTIGNRLNNETSTFWTTNKQELKNTFFNNTTFTEQHLNPDEITIPNDNKATVTWNTLISNTIAEDFNYALHSHALNAELYGLMIFNSEIEYSVLKNHAYGITDLVTENGLNINLSFYLPCVYIADLILRKGYITLGTRDDIAYRSCVNPYFAHKIYGHELSIESFTLDIVNLRRPYILGMNGDEYPNSMSTNSCNFTINDSFVLNDKINLVKDYFAHHKTPTELLNKVMTSNLVLFDNNFSDKSFQFNNIVYRNNFILPCDNGLSHFDLKPIFKLPKIKELLSTATLKNFYHENNPHFVKLDSLYTSSDEYSFQEPIDFFNNENIYSNLFQNPFIELNNLINPPTNSNYVSKTFIDKNNSNFAQQIFYNKILNKDTRPQIQNFFNIQKRIHTNSNNKHLYLNSIFKNIDSNYNASINVPENINIANTNKALAGQSIISYSKYYNSHYSIEGDLGETHSVLFDISNVLYSSQIRPGLLEITDVDLAGSGGALNMKIKDNGHGMMYRADCNGKHATWAHLGHVFYSDGLLNVLHPGLSNFGENNFSFDLKGEHSLYVMQIDIPVERGDFNVSKNPTYIKGLKPSNNLSDLEETNFVYITGVNLHDENMNIIAKAKFAQPIVKRLNDRYNIRLKMDF